MTAQKLPNVCDLFSFFLLLQHVTLHQILTINSLTSNLEGRFGLFFEFDNFLGGVFEVVEVSEDLALRESV